MAPKLSIIILSYNTKDITERCLSTLQKNLQLEKLSYEIIVIDNASTDGSLAMLETFERLNVSTFKLIKNKINIGYTKGNNQGIKKAQGEYVLFLNSDVIVDKINFKRLLGYLDSRTDVGALTVKVMLPEGTIDPASHRGFPALWNSFCYFLKLEKLLGRLPLIGKIFGGYHLTWLDLRTIHEIDSPSGAFYLTRRSIINKLKGFDESFFMYGEDLDLSFRIKNLGYKILYYPLFHVLHLKYASGLKADDAKTKNDVKRHFYGAMKIFYKKHYAKKYFTFLNILVYFFIDLKARL